MIPYGIMLFVGGIPLFYMELALGQVVPYLERFKLIFGRQSISNSDFLFIFLFLFFVPQFYRKGAITSWGRIVPLFKGMFTLAINKWPH